MIIDIVKSEDRINVNPRVSVIIPAFNYGHFLPEALDSVLAQSFQDFEIIVVDDGSTDTTQEAVSAYIKKNPKRIRYFYQDNKGPAAARNKGIREARGEYIAFLDADDLWLPKKLDLQIDRFQNNPNCGLVYTGYYLMNECGAIQGIYSMQPVPKEIIKKRILLTNPMAGTPTIMVRKSCFEKVGYFDEDLVSAEDWDMWLRIIRKYDFAHVREPLVKVRLHKESQSFFGEKNLRNGLRVLDKLFSDASLRKDRLLRRRCYAYRYYSTSRAFMINGDRAKARECLTKSFFLYPFNVFNLAYLRMSFRVLLGK